MLYLINIYIQRLLFTEDRQMPHLFQEMVPLNGKISLQRFQMVLGLQYTFSALWLRGSLCEHCPQVERNFVVTRDRNKKYHIFRHTSAYLDEHHYREQHTHKTTCSSDTSGQLDDDTTTNHIHIEDACSDSLNFNPFWSYSSMLKDTDPKCSCVHVDNPQSESCTRDKANSESTSQCIHPRDQCSRLKIVTYNIWNVNGIQDLEESYEDRLNRMGKVSQLKMTQ